MGVIVDDILAPIEEKRLAPVKEKPIAPPQSVVEQEVVVAEDPIQRLTSDLSDLNNKISEQIAYTKQTSKEEADRLTKANKGRVIGDVLGLLGGVLAGGSSAGKNYEHYKVGATNERATRSYQQAEANRQKLIADLAIQQQNAREKMAALLEQRDFRRQQREDKAAADAYRKERDAAEIAYKNKVLEAQNEARKEELAFKKQEAADRRKEKQYAADKAAHARKYGVETSFSIGGTVYPIGKGQLSENLAPSLNKEMVDMANLKIEEMAKEYNNLEKRDRKGERGAELQQSIAQWQSVVDDLSNEYMGGEPLQKTLRYASLFPSIEKQLINMSNEYVNSMPIDPYTAPAQPKKKFKKLKQF